MTSEPPRPKPVKMLVRRHSLVVRATHWINAISLCLLLFSGLQIFNAHPQLYFGQQSDFGHSWLGMGAYASGGTLHGVTRLGPFVFDTTGFLGVSSQQGGAVSRGFPAWLTIPSTQYLALGRRWHFFFAWVFAINIAIYLASAFLGGHLKRDLAPTLDQLKPRHVLQKGAYLGVVLVLLPLMILTGMTMSPSLDANFPWLLDLFGGRQSARSIHFITASLIVLFFFVHIAMVVLAGPWNEVRSMITGRYAIEVEPPPPVLPEPIGDAP